jgi:hypothetical protein
MRCHKTLSSQRQRTCRAYGKKFDYPVNGNAATRHHCAARTQLIKAVFLVSC